MNRARRTLLIGITLSVLWPASGYGQESARVSPFAYIRWKDVTPEVKVGGAWYALESINDIPLADILDHCRRLHLGRWRRYFDEDLVAVMSEMNQPPGATVVLGVRDLSTGVKRRLTDVAMTAENHAAIVVAHHGDLDESAWIVGTPGVRRAHRDRPHPACAGLSKRVECSKPWAVERMTAKQSAEDLDDLEWHLVNRYAYLDRADVDYEAALDTIRLGLGEGISRGAFATQLAKFLAMFGDGNTRLNRWSDVSTHQTIPWVAFLPPGYAPFMVADAGKKLVAYSGPHHRFLDQSTPYLTSLDGVPIDRWMSVAGGLVARGSPQFVRRLGVTYTMLVGYVRAELGLPNTQRLAIELASGDGVKTRSLTMPIAKTPPAAARKRLIEFKVLDGNVGYLRMTAMKNDPRFMATLFEAMGALRSTTGLVIDVRDNKGGSREPLRALFPFFMGEDDPPFVANVAAARVPPGRNPNRPEGYLGDVALYPISSEYWNARERAAIERFRETFRPKWPPPSGKFSALHYFVLSPRTSAAYYHYDRPVVVLMNAACFSATDVFLGAFKGWPGVTLMGETSGGGDGRPKSMATLLNSGFRVQFSSMASYGPSGTLYYRRGIDPDVARAPTASDVIGKTDTVLDVAVQRLRKPERE